MNAWTNWKGRLDKAKERGKFTDEDKSLVMSWPTCAIGELDVRKTPYGKPLEIDLQVLGGQFDYEVQFDHVDKAIAVVLIKVRGIAEK